VLVLSPAILVEVRRVLDYPRVQARWPLTKNVIDQYLVFLEAAGVLAELPQISPAVVSDPDDDPILQTASVGRADILCTRDEAFRHETVEQVCKAHGIRVLDDIILLQELRRLGAP
jgi:putative PIN family toxin of toxin-antitoxin system